MSEIPHPLHHLSAEHDLNSTVCLLLCPLRQNTYYLPPHWASLCYQWQNCSCDWQWLDTDNLSYTGANFSLLSSSCVWLCFGSCYCYLPDWSIAPAAGKEQVLIAQRRLQWHHFTKANHEVQQMTLYVTRSHFQR